MGALEDDAVAVSELGIGDVVEQPRPRHERLHRVLFLGAQRRRRRPCERQLGEETLRLQPPVDAVPDAVPGRIEERLRKEALRLDVAGEDVAVDPSLAVEHHVRGSDRFCIATPIAEESGEALHLG